MSSLLSLPPIPSSLVGSRLLGISSALLEPVHPLPLVLGFALVGGVGDGLAVRECLAGGVPAGFETGEVDVGVGGSAVGRPVITVALYMVSAV